MLMDRSRTTTRTDCLWFPSTSFSLIGFGVDGFPHSRMANADQMRASLVQKCLSSEAIYVVNNYKIQYVHG